VLLYIVFIDNHGFKVPDYIILITSITLEYIVTYTYDFFSLSMTSIKKVERERETQQVAMADLKMVEQ
jgi:hypothetical protein